MWNSLSIRLTFEWMVDIQQLEVSKLIISVSKCFVSETETSVDEIERENSPFHFHHPLKKQKICL